MKNIPEGILTDLEKDIYILGFECSYSPWFILRVLHQKGYSLEKFNSDSEKYRAKPKIISDLLFDAIDKILTNLPRDQAILFTQQKLVEFHRLGYWRKYSY